MDKHFSLSLCFVSPQRITVTVRAEFVVVGENEQTVYSSPTEDLEFGDRRKLTFGVYKLCDFDGYLVDGTLHAKVSITYAKIGYVDLLKITSSSSVISSKTHQQVNQLKALHDLIDNEDSDFAIEVHGETIGVHKVILRNSWPFFNKMMNAEYIEKHRSRLIVEDHGVHTVKTMVKYIYTREVDFGQLQSKQVIDLFKAAHQYELDELAEQCIDRIIVSIHDLSVIRLMTFAVEERERSYSKVIANKIDKLIANLKEWIMKQRTENRLKLRDLPDYEWLKGFDNEFVFKVFEMFLGDVF